MPAPSQQIYVLDRASVRAVDRDAVEIYRMPSIVLMENAARGLAAEALEMLRDRDTRRVLIICGSGNNGGDGYALARHLHNAGCEIALVALGEPKPHSDAAINLDICKRMNLANCTLEDIAPADRFDLVVDAIFGTGLDGPVRDEAAAAIEWINRCGVPVLAADIPSGLDCDTGEPLGIAVRASGTVTFVGFKPGFLVPEAQEYLGKVVVADIGAPIELTRKYGVPLERRDR